MEPFKNLISEKTAYLLSQNIKRHYKSFNEKEFNKNIKQELAPLELKDRVKFLSKKLHDYLPDDFKEAAPILLGVVNDQEKQSTLSGFDVWPLTEYVASYGLDQFEISMNLLKEMTKIFTSEFAVRSFFIKHQDHTLKMFKKWIKDENEHVRRLVSEGSRPLLPWGQKLPGLIEEPNLTMELLEKLKNDKSLYVRKSVANHLNDHSKNHPDLVVKTLEVWKKEDPNNKNIEWIIRHASRTLVKKAHPKALALHGVTNAKIKVSKIKLKKTAIELNESLMVTIRIENTSKKDAFVIIDSDIDFLKANGSHLTKCFKGKKITLRSQEARVLEIKIPIKKVTTRKYYEGTHYVSLKINGKNEKRIQFFLKC